MERKGNDQKPLFTRPTEDDRKTSNKSHQNASGSGTWKNQPNNYQPYFERAPKEKRGEPLTPKEEDATKLSFIDYRKKL